MITMVWLAVRKNDFAKYKTMRSAGLKFCGAFKSYRTFWEPRFWAVRTPRYVLEFFSVGSLRKLTARCEMARARFSKIAVLTDR